jgi:hypothetical protein
MMPSPIWCPGSVLDVMPYYIGENIYCAHFVEMNYPLPISISGMKTPLTAFFTVVVG